MIKNFKTYLIIEKVDKYVSDIMLDVHKIIDDNFSKDKYYLDLKDKYGISFFINILKKDIVTLSIYYSNISIKEILKNNFIEFNIDFYIEDQFLNSNKIFGIL